MWWRRRWLLCGAIAGRLRSKARNAEPHVLRRFNESPNPCNSVAARTSVLDGAAGQADFNQLVHVWTYEAVVSAVMRGATHYPLVTPFGGCGELVLGLAAAVPNGRQPFGCGGVAWIRMWRLCVTCHMNLWVALALRSAQH